MSMPGSQGKRLLADMRFSLGWGFVFTCHVGVCRMLLVCVGMGILIESIDQIGRYMSLSI